jgi:hypothetical protein
MITLRRDKDVLVLNHGHGDWRIDPRGGLPSWWLTLELLLSPLAESLELRHEQMCYLKLLLGCLQTL